MEISRSFFLAETPKYGSPVSAATALIILNWKKPDLTLKCLSAVKKNTVSKIHVILVEQEAFSPESKPSIMESFLERNFSSHEVLLYPKNIGVPKGYNEGIKAALKKPEIKYISILNNDTEVWAGWLEALIGCAESDPKIGVVGAKAVRYDGTIPGFGQIMLKDGNAFGKGAGAPEGTPESNVQCELYSVGMACSLIRRELIEDIGMFDEEFTPCCWEDTEYCFRARSKGWKVVYCPSAKYYHVEGATFKGSGMEKYYDEHRKLFLSKWGGML